MTRHRIFDTAFAAIYPLYLAKVERKGRTAAELSEVICWLTGYDEDGLRRAIADEVSLDEFFSNAPRMHPNAPLVTGVICGHRIEEIADPLMQNIRRLDKLVDELARGRKLLAILR